MRAWTTLAMVLAGCAASSSAQERAEPDPLMAVESADPMELARVVDRLGDEAVLARLDASRPRAARLAAVRAAPQMRWPELALAPLAELAAGRDPLLAPAAAQSALSIARSLEAHELARREVDPASLGGARARLIALSRDESAREDIRVTAALAEARLESIGVPER